MSTSYRKLLVLATGVCVALSAPGVAQQGGFLDLLRGGSSPPPNDPFIAARRGPTDNPPVATPPNNAAPANPTVPPNNAVRPNNAAPAGNPPGNRYAPGGARVQPAAAPAHPAMGVAAVQSPNPPGAADAAALRKQCDAMLIDARRALAMGDWRRTEHILGRAKSLGVAYRPQDDSPAKVEALVLRHKNMEQLRPTAGDSPDFRRAWGQFLLEQADGLLRWGQFDDADRIARAAELPGVRYGRYEKSPQEMYTRIAQARLNRARFPQPPPKPGERIPPSPSNPVSAHPAGRAPAGRNPVERVTYNELQPGAPPPDAAAPPNQYRLPPPAAVQSTQAMRLYLEGERALDTNQTDRARQLFQQAEKRAFELDPQTLQRLRGRLQYLGRGQVLTEAAKKQMVLRRQISAELATSQGEARRLQKKDPLRAMAVLEQARIKLAQTEVEPAIRDQLLLRVDGDINRMRQYVKENEGLIKLDQNNRLVRDEMERERKYKVEVEERLAMLVNEFNRLMDQQMYRQAELKAREAEMLAPKEPVVQQLKWQSRFVRNLRRGEQIRDAKAQNNILALESVEASSEPFNDREPHTFPHNWLELSHRRQAFHLERRRSPREIEIEQKLRTPVSLHLTDKPLSEVIFFLAGLTEVNMYLDPAGLAEEGVDTGTPITIDLRNEVSLKSALNLILEPLNLSYVIKDEVLKITSINLRDGDTFTQTYNVADLVIPIPNFVPTVNMGMAGALQEAYRQAGSLGYGGHAPVAVAATQNGGTSNATIGKNVLANMSSLGGGGGYGGPSGPVGKGPGGIGGGMEPDYDQLIQLITQTISPRTWEEVGGPGSIAPFAGTLSLVVSNTQEVHQQVADLLQQLRKLQDLQVTIEVRFISLNDNFFERIGVDFDFDLDDDIDRPFQVFGAPDFNQAAAPAGTLFADHPRNLQDRDHGPSVAVGLTPQGFFTADLDIPVAQGSFPLAVPQFGGFQPGAGATVGFAILSEIEAFFLIEASQGDRRSNVLQAPKVTLFNGQQAIVSDTTQTPFVISVIPVVGDFAAAQQPVIVVLNEGTFLNVQAVVSDDRRFVRLTMVPFFSTIGEVNTFTFQGSEQVVDELDDSNLLDDVNDSESSSPPTVNRRVSSRQGTTVQLPSFSFITVSTTVSVPDGGTVLLGGIKRLSEGRNEFGVPILNKLPYINRLFKNVGIGRETQSLLMMVTPRIIIQEEEERELFGDGAGP